MPTPPRPSKTRHHQESVAYRKTAAHLGERVRALRETRGWTVERAAEKFGIEPAHVRRIEGAHTNPSLAILVSIARAFNVHVADLLGDRARTRRG